MDLPLASDRDHTVLYENINVKEPSRSQAPLVLPRYHEILALQEEKKVRHPTVFTRPCPSHRADPHST